VANISKVLRATVFLLGCSPLKGREKTGKKEARQKAGNMPKIRSIAEIAAKWGDVTPRREAYYRHGIESPKKVWVEEASAASDAWREGVTAAAAEDRFGKGVAAVGQEKWKKGALEKGVKMGRWREGVAIAKDEYAKGFAPYRDVIEAITLPPRGPKGDPRNIERVSIVTAALHAKKLEKFR